MPRRLPAVCCRVEVVNGGCGRRRYGLVSIDITVKSAVFKRRSHGGGTSLIKLANVRREPVRGQLAVGTEILGAGESLAAERDHAGGEFGTLPQRVRRGQRGDDIPVRRALERHAFALAFHDQAGGHGLHAA